MQSISASPPLYEKVAQSLRQDILSGRYPVGATLPTEGELCATFEVSRHTVREALRRLKDDGLLASRRGAGTVVTAPQKRDVNAGELMSVSDLLAFAGDTDFHPEWINPIELDAALAERTGLIEGTSWLAVRGLRISRVDARPVCWTEYYIDRRYAAVGRLLARHQGPIFPLLEDMFGLTVVDVEQQISASILSEDLAIKLDVASGGAALDVRRSYMASAGDIVQVTLNIHPSSLFKHTMKMRRIAG